MNRLALGSAKTLTGIGKRETMVGDYEVNRSTWAKSRKAKFTANYRVSINRVFIVSTLLIASLASVIGSAQHAHEAGPPLLGLTSPKDDSVLAKVPPVIVLSFRSNVRLLKLRLLSAGRQHIDIGFFYDPERIDNNFVWKLPTLPGSSYYIVAWAVVDEGNQLVEGEFNFAVGDVAISPSEFIEQYGLYVDHQSEDSTSPPAKSK
jgi:methionine-rich copper-binding protein CopC